mgnify:CR=1 FL=1
MRISLPHRRQHSAFSLHFDKKMVCVYCFLRQSYVISSRQIKQITIKIDIKESRINVEKDRGLDYAWRSTRIIRDMSTLCCREWFQAEVMTLTEAASSGQTLFLRYREPRYLMSFCIFAQHLTTDLFCRYNWIIIRRITWRKLLQ